jgi:hypothetical protein
VQPAVTDRKPPWWLWPTILSLDAPVVAVLWQAMIASSAGVMLGAPERDVLGWSVWLAYAADRWIEGWRLKPEQIRTHRHRFHVRWRWELFIVWVGVLVLDVATAFRALTNAELRDGALLLSLVAAYLLSHQLVHRASRWRVPKEACVALLLAGGAAVFIAPQAGASVQRLAAPLVLFALLCFANCALISVWENEVDVSHGQTSLALQYAGAARVSRLLPWFIVIAAAAAWLVAGASINAVAGCAFSSAVLLGCIDAAERSTGRILARVLADVALLTPLVPLLLGEGPR